MYSPQTTAERLTKRITFYWRHPAAYDNKACTPTCVEQSKFTGCLHGAIVAAIDRRDWSRRSIAPCKQTCNYRRNRPARPVAPSTAHIIAPTVASCKQTCDRSRRQSLRRLRRVNTPLRRAVVETSRDGVGKITNTGATVTIGVNL